MTDAERARFEHAFEAGRDAGEQARYWAKQGNQEEAERYLIEAAREIDAALKAIGSKVGVRIEEPEE